MRDGIVAGLFAGLSFSLVKMVPERVAGIGPERRALLAKPHVRLYGTVDASMYAKFLDEFRAAPSDGPIVVAITTLGGDPEVARSMARLSACYAKTMIVPSSSSARWRSILPGRHSWRVSRSRIAI